MRGRIRKAGLAWSASCAWVRGPLARGLNRLMGEMRDEEGQSTVEYLVVLIATVAVVVGLGSLLAAERRGVFSGLATRALSHATGGVDTFAALAEIFLF